MSKLLIDRNPALARLRADGYSVEVRNGFLLMHDIPYVTATKQIKRGILAANVTTAGEIITQQDHTAWFSGEEPCDANGNLLGKIVIDSKGRCVVDDEITLQHRLSSKPITTGAYGDFHEKMTTYADMITSHAAAIDPSVTAKLHRPIESTEDESVFKYMDSASSRARINEIAGKVKAERLAIIGLGGSGAYVLDLVAKTTAKEINLYDGDNFYSHNAFRAPGAASIDELNNQLSKVDYLSGIYSKMRWGIEPHNFYITEQNISCLQDKTFVFICVDKGPVRDLIFRHLEMWKIPFIDVGMGIGQIGSSLEGIIRITTSTPEMSSHIRKDGLVSFADADEENIYDQNIQVAELNSLAASFAVLKWKKLRGIYQDIDREHHTTLTLDGNMLLNEYKP